MEENSDGGQWRDEKVSNLLDIYGEAAIQAKLAETYCNRMLEQPCHPHL